MFRPRVPQARNDNVRRLDPRRSPVEGLGKYTEGDEDNYRHRMVNNILAFVVLVAIVYCGVWLAEYHGRHAPQPGLRPVRPHQLRSDPHQRPPLKRSSPSILRKVGFSNPGLCPRVLAQCCRIRGTGSRGRERSDALVRNCEAWAADAALNSAAKYEIAGACPGDPHSEVYPFDQERVNER